MLAAAFQALWKIVGRSTGESEEICTTNIDQHSLDFTDIFIIRKVKVDRVKEVLVMKSNGAWTRKIY